MAEVAAGLSVARLRAVLAAGGRSAAEASVLARLIVLLLARPDPPDPFGLCSSYPVLRRALVAATAGQEGEQIEEALLALYAALHGHAAPYTPAERARLDASGGYWCHAGGLSPIVHAAARVRAESRAVDYGAGNGLQLLLLQVLAPHRCSVQVELSLAMLLWGRSLQTWLGVPADRVAWVCADVADVRCHGFDLVYLYRPVRPEGPGRAFYERLAGDLRSAHGPVSVLSVADGLRGFLGGELDVEHDDGHLTVFRAGGGGA